MEHRQSYCLKTRSLSLWLLHFSHRQCTFIWYRDVWYPSISYAYMFSASIRPQWDHTKARELRMGGGRGVEREVGNKLLLTESWPIQECQITIAVLIPNYLGTVIQVFFFLNVLLKTKAERKDISDPFQCCQSKARLVYISDRKENLVAADLGLFYICQQRINNQHRHSWISTHQVFNYALHQVSRNLNINLTVSWSEKRNVPRVFIFRYCLLWLRFMKPSCAGVLYKARLCCLVEVSNRLAFATSWNLSITASWRI